MPLPDPAPRSELQTRNITCTAYRRDDGFWEIEGHLVDTNTYAFTTAWGRAVPAGVPLHEISLRWTISEDMVIQEIAAAMDAVPYPPICPNATAAYQKLLGATVGKGFLKEARTRIARAEGCTHLFTLIEDMANMTMRTVAGQKMLSADTRHQVTEVFGSRDDRPALLNSCHSYGAHSPVTKLLWPSHYSGPEQS